jgi:capsular polysaccharide biosynthesis protein
VESEESFHKQARVLPLYSKPLQEIGGLSLCLTGPWSWNYFHWLMQYLPILRIAETIHPLSEIDHVIVRGPVKPFHLESLTEFGIPPHKVISIEADQSMLIENMLVTTVPCDNFRYSSWAISLLKEMTPYNQEKSGPIFLDRPVPNNRRIVNSEEVLSLLTGYGAKIIDCGKLSFREQINLASSTRLIIGVHGASLANCVFSSPGTTLLELMPRNYTPPYFSALAASCGLKYLGLAGREPGPLLGNIPIYDADMIVPIKRLRRMMDFAAMA